ncbi:hypothetical protein LCGC14_2587160, partial [marine sediment metagenome]
YNDVWLGVLKNDKVDFDKIPTVKVEKELVEYDLLPTTGKDRLIYRHSHPELEKWFVEQKGYTPVEDRWMGEVSQPKEAKEEPAKAGEEELTEIQELERRLRDRP